MFEYARLRIGAVEQRNFIQDFDGKGVLLAYFDEDVEMNLVQRLMAVAGKRMDFRIVCMNMVSKALPTWSKVDLWPY